MNSDKAFKIIISLIVAAISVVFVTLAIFVLIAVATNPTILIFVMVWIGIAYFIYRMIRDA